MDWKVIEYDITADSIFLKKGSQLSVSGIRQLQQLVTIRLIQGLSKTGDEYDETPGGVAALVQLRMDANILKSRIKLLVDAVKTKVVNEQAVLDIPDSERLQDLRVTRLDVNKEEAEVDVTIINAEGGSATISF